MTLLDLDFSFHYQTTQPNYLTQGDLRNIPQEFKYLSAIKMLDSIKVCNFKSFKGEHYIGPFLKFTTLIGANGSGKSSILDAILFCLAGDKFKGAYFESKEYISRAEDETYKELRQENRQCWVECKFLLVGGGFLYLKRTVDTQNKSQYFLNNSEVAKKDYVSFLRTKYLIVSQTTNLAIWQGVSDMIISKEPKKVRYDLEILSGTALIKEEFDKLEKDLADVVKEMAKMTTRKDRLKNDKRSLKFLKDSNDEYIKLDKQYKELLEKALMSKLLLKQVELRRLEDEIDKQERKEAKELEQYNKKKAEAQQNFKKSVEIKSQVNELNLEITNLNFKLKESSNQNMVFKEQNLRDLKEEQKKDNQTVEILQLKKKSLEERLPKVQSSALIEEYLQVYEAWQKQNMLLKDTFQKKQANLATMDRLIYSKQDLIQNLKQKSKKYDVDKSQQYKKLQQAQAKLGTLEISISNCKKELSRYSSQYASAESKLKSHYKQLLEKDTWIQQLQYLVSEENQDYKQSSTNKKLEQIDGYIGLVEDKAMAGSDKYAVCFELIMSSIDKYVLVQNEEASKRVAARLKDLGKTKTVVILSNTKSGKDAIPEMRKMLGNKAVPAMDIVNYDREIDKLGDFLSNQLKGKIICESLDDAFELRNKHLKGVKQIYTVGGDVINMNGLITSHGDPSTILKSRKYMKNKNQNHFKRDIEKAKQERQSIKALIKSIKSQFNQSLILKKQQEIKALQNKKDDAANELQRWKNYKPNNKKVQNLQALEQELAELKDKREKLNNSIVATQRQIESSPALRKFLQSNKIQSIQCFRNANNIQQLEKSMALKNELQRQITGVEEQLTSIQKKTLRQKIEQLQQQLNKSSSAKYRKQLQRQVKLKQKQIQKKNNEISNLKISFDQRFHARSPQLRQKLSQMTSSLSLYLQSLNSEYQTNIQQPEYTSILHDMDSTLESVTKEDIVGYLERIKNKRNQVETTIEKFASFSLVNDEEQGQNLGQIEKSLDEVDQNLDLLVQKRDQLTKQLNLKKDVRRNTFIEFLTALRETIKKIYAFLTFGGDPPIHGTADLFIENDESPFDSGVYYCPTPPTKRFIYEVDQLSGGEKSIACLAYQFAVAITTKSPFLILDEVDDFLDNNNVMKFKKLLMKMKEDHQLQCIVVSHKPGIFEQSQSLVGISNHMLDLTSKAFSLQL